MTSIGNRQSAIGNVPPVSGDNPWPGLASFTEDTRAFFFGRERETDDMLRLVSRQTLTVLFGQSGLGKSSLLQAGLFPRLRETDHLPLYLRLNHDPSSPPLAEQVKQALGAAFLAAGADAPPIGPDVSLWEYFHRKDVDIWSAKNRLLTPVLAFDQFEEMFTLGRATEPARERSRAFLSELADLVENRPPTSLQDRFETGASDPAQFNYDKPSCRVILSLREDFLPELEGLRQDLPALIHNRHRLKRLNGMQALEAVRCPAPQLLADGVAEKIVEFVSGARGGSTERLAELDVEPPLLSVICRELNERRRALGQAQITADLVTGNRREILHDFYERSVADLPEPMRRFVEDKLLTKSGFRDNLALETALEEPGVTRPLIDTLVSRRLLRIEDRIGTQRVELTHDVLADVVRASRDARQQRLALEQAQARERAALAANARRTRRMRLMIGGLAALVVALCTAGAYGLHARQAALKSASRTDVTFAARLLESGNTAEGLAYFVRAARQDRHNTSIGPRLLSALVSRNFLLPQGPPLVLPAAVMSVHYAADGQRVWVLGNDGIVRVVDPQSRRVAQEFRSPSKVDEILFPADTDRVFVAVYADQSLQTCDADTGKPVCPLMRAPSRIGGRVFVSHDGRWLGAESDSKVFIWDAANGRALSTLDLGERTPMSVAFSPDGTRVLTGMVGGSVRQWSTEDGSPLLGEIRPAPTGNAVGGGVAYSRDGLRFAVAWSTGGAQLFETATGRRIGPALKQDVINRLAFSPDGRRLFTMGSDRAVFSVHTWDALTGAEQAPPWSSPLRAVDIMVSRDDGVALTADFEGAVHVWDFASGKELAEPTPALGRDVRLALSRDGSRILVAGGRALHFLDLGAGAARPLELHRGALTLPIIFLAGNPTRILWPGTDRARVIDIASGRESAGGFTFPKPILPIGAGSALRGDGTAMVVALKGTSGEPNPAGWEAWMIHGGAVTHTVPLAGVPLVPSWIRFSPAGNLAATVSSTTRDAIRVWDLNTGQPVGPAVTFDSRIFTTNALPASFSADGKLLVAGSVSGSARVWEVATGRSLFDLGPQGGRVCWTAFSPDGTRLVVGAVSSSGGAMAAIGASMLRIWDVASGRLVREPVTVEGQVHIAFSEDSGRFITQTPAETRVWDARTGEPMSESLATLARGAGFSHDGRRLAIARNDSVAQVWDAETFEPVTEPLPHPGVRVVGPMFSPDDRMLRTETSDDRYLFWSLPPEADNDPVPDWLLDLATLCIGQRLTAEGRLESTGNQAMDVATLRRELAALPDDAPYVAWGRWFLADRATRSIAPGFTITPAEAEKLAQEPGPATASP